MSRVVVNEIQAKVGNDISFNDTVKIDTLKGKTTAGTITLQCEGNHTSNVQQGLSKSWVRYNQTGTPALTDSFNTANITDHATGHAGFSFTVNMGNANYCLVGMSYDDGSGSADGKQALCVAGGTANPSTSAYNLYAHDNINSAEVDIAINSCSINGDLA